MKGAYLIGNQHFEKSEIVQAFIVSYIISSIDI